ncbi:survival motor neuron protein [Danaus plexippus plexippus]|uniref:Survival motor neuron protein n=1 Tax=Danaus plexippus plexippus TaxID=278856 RepID=A0A212ERG4_DANPL|nr:survival motor neuron protein [Danaus plexippus plexippus]
MSRNDVLYVKGMAFSDTDEAEEDIWDDSKLNDAYDKALKIANAEVAKRVAMSTNTAQSKDANSKTKSKSNKCPKWKVGMHCRAAYEGDGIEYEAVLLRIINDKECVIKFIGYDNTELVSMSDLKQSLGNAEREQQMKDSLADKNNDLQNYMDISDRATSPGSTASLQRKKKNGKKKNKQKHRNSFEFPDIPLPNLPQFRNFSPLDVPPPMLHPPQESEDQALSSMLLSWYMSGYYTGLYQGIKR